ncbi:hypothetical protein PVAP13_9KG342100 [Panicum virgatum]|uniref:Uncharacterized protein n=1 Tax=Panicum virgatum TaxID=38727 RepID=A0A8T0NT63_PANVG|nr:hypothetical protein PVAP13_9KG342100 [Panicum virgatum]
MIASCDDAPDGQQAMMWHMNMTLRSCPRPPRASLLACRVRRVMRLSAPPGHLPPAAAAPRSEYCWNAPPRRAAVSSCCCLAYRQAGTSGGGVPADTQTLRQYSIVL